MSDKPKTGTDYESALHMMQTGVAFDPSSEANMGIGDRHRAFKHLRVGINSCMVDHTALVRLLIQKGIITEAEYKEEVRLEMCREADRYGAKLGNNIKLL